jgi:hypothetical protein
MKTRGSRRLTCAHILIWSALALAIVATGAPPVYRDLATYSPRSPGPYHSTDSFLRFATGSSASSENVLDRFGLMPSSRAILIFYNNADPRSSLLAMTTAYLAWPHPVRLLEVTAPGARAELSHSNREDVGALVFCRLNQSLLSEHSFDDRLKILRVSP